MGSETSRPERICSKAKLTLAETDDICRSHESTATQMKLVDEAAGGAVSAIESGPEKSKPKPKPQRGSGELRECRNCGRKHDFYKRELCPAFQVLNSVVATPPITLLQNVAADPGKR